MNKKFLFFSLLLMVFVPVNLYLQEDKGKIVSYQYTGFRKYLTNFSRSDCEGLWVNRAILQDRRGVIYVGGDGGLREFDGNSWRSIPIPNNWTSAMAIDEKNTIYIGGNNEIGYLTADTRGSLHYKSLVYLLKEKQKNFSILRIHTTPGGIYFNAGKFLFLRDSHTGKIKVWQASSGFDLSFTCAGDLYIQQTNLGLMKMKSNSLHLIPAYEKLAAEKICMLVPYNSQKLVGTRSSKLYLCDDKKAVPFPTQADDYLKKNRLLHGIRLSGGDFALATFFGGLVVIDPQGRIKDIFTQSSGLPDDLVNYIFEDFQGNLWLALDMAVTKIEYASPLSFHYDPPEFIRVVTRYRNVLYVGTNNGLYFLNPAGNFQPVPGFPDRIYDLHSSSDSLLVSTLKGVFQVKGENSSKLIDNTSFTFTQSQTDKNRVWGQKNFTIFSLYRKSGQWYPEHQFEGKDQITHTIAEDPEGNLWLGAYNKFEFTSPKGVLKVTFSGRGTFSNPLITRYDASHGLPTNIICVFNAAGHVLFSTDKGLYFFDEQEKFFSPDFTLGQELASLARARGINNLVEDTKKNIWISFYDYGILQALHQPEGTYVLNQTPFLRIPPQKAINGIYPEPGGDITWFYSDNQLIRFDSTIKKNYRHPFPTLIRRVYARGKLVFGGYAIDSLPSIPFSDRNIGFEFAAPFYENESANQYRYFLEGYEDHWSDWTRDNKKDYNELGPGLYRFRVQAKNIYQQSGTEASFQFKILLPWYRTWWAFLSYALVLAMLSYLVFKWRRASHLEKEKQTLEHMVEERTKEVNRKNLQLQQQTLRLKEQSQKLKEIDAIKSRFFTNISHEFRTPLTLIMGPLEQMLAVESLQESEVKRKLKLMLRNSQRLLSLIDQLLELSKLESGTIKLQAAPQNIILFLKGITASFEPVATKNELELTFQAEQETMILYFDPGKLEEVFFNLLSNAIKFTPAGGKIMVKVSGNSAPEADFPLGFLEISVCDTGPGIPRDQMAYIFDRFYQSDSTYEHHQKGTGIGLAIARELIELHHGKIEVRSCIGKGTEFLIRLPVGGAHLKPGEIAQPGTKPFKHKSPGDIPVHFKLEKEQVVPPGKKGVPGEPAKNIILIVEDHDDFRKYLKGDLEPFYKVVEAGNGQEGIEKAAKIIPDLIISDVMMPEVDGYELCRRLKNNIKTSHIPIILLTAKASEENIIEGLETGVDDYITKPFSTKMLHTRIKNLINQRRQLQVTRRRQLTEQSSGTGVSSLDEIFYQELQDVMEKNLSNPEFNVEQLKKKLHMGRTTLYRKITALTGEPPNKFIRLYRLKRAAQLLKENVGNVTEVAFQVGFTNMAYFSQCFKEEFQQLPSRFQAGENETNQ